MSTLKLAIIGCGAVTELFHLPAARLSSKLQVTVLVDRNLPRARQLAQRYGVEHVVDDHHAIGDKATAAIVALPHSLHAPVSIELLRQGLHVLVEKPMALKAAECDAMVEVANVARRTLAVGLVRRFYPASLYVKQMLDAGLFGKVLGFDVREGFIYDWPVASDFYFDKEMAGGGVLVDTGAHTLDLLLWWLGDCADFEYEDDAFGGVEANCLLRLRVESGAEGVVELSRVRNLRNTIRIRGERATLEVGCGFPCPVRLHSSSGELALEGEVRRRASPSPEFFLQVVRRQLENFADAVLGGSRPFVSGQEARRSVALIEACYRRPSPLDLPWVRVPEGGSR